MEAITKELQSLLERERIRDCIARLARGEDRRNAELIRACYWPDSTNDYGVFFGTFDQSIDSPKSWNQSYSMVRCAMRHSPPRRSIRSR